MSEREAKLVSIIEDYLAHISWRCDHTDRFPWVDGECMCGLVGALKDAGLPVEWAENAGVAR